MFKRLINRVVSFLLMTALLLSPTSPMTSPVFADELSGLATDPQGGEDLFDSIMEELESANDGSWIFTWEEVAAEPVAEPTVAAAENFSEMTVEEYKAALKETIGDENCIIEVSENDDGTYSTNIEFTVENIIGHEEAPSIMPMAADIWITPGNQQMQVGVANKTGYISTNATPLTARQKGFTNYGFHVRGNALHLQTGPHDDGSTWMSYTLYPGRIGSWVVYSYLINEKTGYQLKSEEVTFTATDPNAITPQINNFNASMQIGSTQVVSTNIFRELYIGILTPYGVPLMSLKPIWESSNPAVATVQLQNNTSRQPTEALITAISPGTTTITVRSDEQGTILFGDHRVSKVLTVQKIPVTSVTVSGPTTVNIGQSIQMSSIVAPSNATYQTRIWTCNPVVATVDNYGKVTGVGVGRTQVYATVDGVRSNLYWVEVIQPPTGVTVTPTAQTIGIGGTTALKATVNPAGANQAVTWTSGNTSIATVNASGVVTGVNNGTVTITARSVADTSKTAAATITVNQPVTGITVNPASNTINTGQTFTITANVTPSNAANRSVTWSSNNTTVATVNANGLVSGVGPGTATITAKTADGGKTATCTVTVKSPVTGISITPANGAVNVGNTLALTATITPADASNKNITWSSNNTGIATVNESGVVTGAAPGAVTITATTQDGSKTATSQITVHQPVTGVAVTPKTGTLMPGETLSLNAAVAPANASNPAISWESSNPDIAPVSGNGLVTAVAPGSVTVMVRTADGNKTDTCQITVAVPVTGVEVSPKYTEIEIGETLSLTATVNPANATTRAVSWTSSDNAIARVDANGTVTGTGAGTVTITVTTADGNKQDTALVEVLPDSIYITTPEELKAVANDLNRSYKLGNDINMAGHDWLPLGSASNPFTGMLDGQGYAIQNLHINHTLNTGLFASIDGGTVRNLTIANPDIKGTNYTGAISGVFSGGLIENCVVSGAGAVSGNAYVGGISGTVAGGTIRACAVTVEVKGVNGNVGGIAGVNNGNIERCYATGNITAGGNVGGLVGIGESGRISESYATGKVQATGSNAAGGLLGQLTGGIVENSMAYGQAQLSPDRSYAGGLIGNAGAATVTNCYALGKASGLAQLGGLFGRTLGTQVTSSYFSIQTAGFTFPSEQARTNDEMFNKTTYAGWDMENIWDIDDGQDYPYLRNLPKPVFTGIEDPYTIKTPEQLQNIANDLNGYYQLANDIDMSGFPFVSLGNNQQRFQGSLDGNGYVISNLTVTNTGSFTGLFAYTQEADLKNITLKDPIINGAAYTGALAGVMVDGTIDNCLVAGTGQINSTGATVGGLVGHLESGSIRNSGVESGVAGARGNVGGLVGINNGNVEKSFATGNVSGMGIVGGLIGLLEEGTVKESYATGAISATTTTGAGGLIGQMSGGTLSDSFATGSVLVCRNYSGGLIGNLTNGNVMHCYAAGAIVDVSGSRVGGLFGNNDGTVGNCYFDSSVTGINVPAGQARTTAQMVQQANFTGWDFVSTWAINEGNSYPVLKDLPAPLFKTLIIEHGNGEPEEPEEFDEADLNELNGENENKDSGSEIDIQDEHSADRIPDENENIQDENSGADNGDPELDSVYENGGRQDLDDCDNANADNTGRSDSLNDDVGGQVLNIDWEEGKSVE